MSFVRKEGMPASGHIYALEAGATALVFSKNRGMYLYTGASHSLALIFFTIYQSSCRLSYVLQLHEHHTDQKAAKQHEEKRQRPFPALIEAVKVFPSRVCRRIQNFV